jgi:tRNA(fMet)-specific endonuclease VapC
MSRRLLDTNVVIDFFNGDGDITTQLGETSQIFLPVTVLGELYFGAAHSGRPQANKERIDELKAECVVVPVDVETAELYGEVRLGLRRRGRPIPENDAWIAASALRHGLVLVTRDRHFEGVDGLVIERW